jgi:hypothetical protein
VPASIPTLTDTTFLAGKLPNLSRFWAGNLGAMRVYNRAISATEALEHYRGIFKNNTGLTAAWNFDEGSGTTSNDDTDNNYNLTLQASPTWIRTALDGRWDLTAGNTKLYAPVNVTETFAEHFTSHSYSTIQDAINGGSHGLSPAPSSAQYVEVLDYGSTLAATRIVVTLTSSTILGSVTVTPKISVKLNAGDAWTDYNNVWTVYATQFRYVKVTLDLSTAGGLHMLAASQLNFTLDVKLINDGGMGTANSGDAGGTTVTFNVDFADVTSITVTPGGTTAVIPTYDFTDTPNPTSFKVLLFDKDGNRVSGPFSWSAKGV